MYKEKIVDVSWEELWNKEANWEYRVLKHPLPLEINCQIRSQLWEHKTNIIF